MEADRVSPAPMICCRRCIGTDRGVDWHECPDVRTPRWPIPGPGRISLPRGRDATSVMRHRARRVAARFFAALACAMLATSEARGDCAHPDQLAGAQPGGIFDLLLYRFDGGPGPLPTFPGDPQPCRPGSSCSRGPDSPIAPAPAGVSPLVDRWGCLASPAGVQDPSGPSLLRPWNPPLRPITGGDAPFHPPRPA